MAPNYFETLILKKLWLELTPRGGKLSSKAFQRIQDPDLLFQLESKFVCCPMNLHTLTVCCKFNRCTCTKQTPIWEGVKQKNSAQNCIVMQRKISLELPIYICTPVASTITMWHKAQPTILILPVVSTNFQCSYKFFLHI